MKKKTFYILILASLLCGIVVVQTFAGSDDGAGGIQRADFLLTGKHQPGLKPMDGSASLPMRQELLSGARDIGYDPSTIRVVPPAESATFEAAEPGSTTCRQLLGNTGMEIVLIDPTSGFAEPWVEFIGEVYFIDEPFPPPPDPPLIDVYEGDYSLLVVVGDTGDETPETDWLAQAFYMPDNLDSLEIVYHTATLFPNSIDEAWGDLWTVTADGYLDQHVAFWPVGEFTSWQQQPVSTTNPDILEALEDEYVAIVLSNFTTIPTPGELVFFDAATLEACYPTPNNPNPTFLPILMQQQPAQAVCVSSTEDPPDTYDANRGLETVDGICNTTLSQLDKQDYYTFVVTQADRYRIRLYDLPSGSNWSATLFEDHSPYPIPPGLSGDCRTTAPGDADKSVLCDLPVGEYFIKVAAGDWTGGVASYKMKVTRP